MEISTKDSSLMASIRVKGSTIGPTGHHIMVSLSAASGKDMENGGLRRKEETVT